MTLARKLFPLRCISYNEKLRPCKHRVNSLGQRCKTCWEALSIADDIAIRMAVAAEPNVPSRILTRLASDKVMSVRMAVAGLPDLPHAVQSALAQDQLAVRRVLITNPSLDPQVYNELTTTNDPYIQRMVRQPKAIE